MINCLKNRIILTLLAGLLLSVSLSFFFINKFNNYDDSVSERYEHRMLKSDPEKFWIQAHNLQIDLKNQKNFFDTGYEYRISYLPSKILYIYSVLFNEKFYEYDEKIVMDPLIGVNDIKENKIKINKNNKKFIFLILQSVIYYLSIYFLYLRINKFFDKDYIFYLILFLSFEPNLLVFHSSFWSESIFFSLLIFCVALIIDKDFSMKSNITLGLLLGLLFLQRSVAIYYIFIVLIYYLFFLKEFKFKKIFILFFSYSLILLFLGYHNFNRSSVFQIKPTQAMDGFYVYMTQNIIAEKNGKSLSETIDMMEDEKNTWVEENNINFKNEKDKIKYYKYLEKKSFNIIKSNLFLSIKFVINKTLHYLVFDPFRHVNSFYKYSLNEQNSFIKTDEHKNKIFLRIIYSLAIYLLAIIGFFRIFKEQKNFIPFLFLILSIIYFVSVSSWTGNNRYHVPNLIFISFFVVKGFEFIKKNLINKP